jgi:hypothetical protein
MSGLFHLVEAATVLTQLGPSTMRPSTAYAASSSSTSPLTTANLHVASISDDDETMANAFTTMAKLRENHLQALCAAAADASSATASTIPAPTSTAYAADVSANLTSTTSVYPTPTTISQRDSGESSSTTTTAREMFPMRLHALLADPSVRDVITWLPHGKSFVVLRPDVFATHVLPRYFAPEGSNSLTAKLPNAVSADGNNMVTIFSNIKGVHKYPSFTRKLNRWGFRQISRGPDSGAFCHDLFQRDDPELCRGMVCQKSRKSKNNSSSRNSDDMISVSSGSTMETVNKSITSIEKRRFSSIVTVSTAGVTSSTNKSSLPLKKRKSGHHHTTNTTTDNYMMNGIPSMISHRFQKMSSSSSVTESDLTSENGSVGSNNNTNNNQNIELKSSSNGGASDAVHVAETLARETLAHHFHEQRRAFALASLLENSRLAIEAAGMNSNHASSVSDASSLPMVSMQASFNQPTMYYQSSQTTEGVGELCAAPPPVSIEMKSAYVPPPPTTTSSSLSTAEAAKIALYKAYIQALTESSSFAP